MNWIKSIWISLWKDPWQSRFVVPLLLINIMGSAYGYYWYSGQLAETAKKLWLFVPDSPLATTLLAVVLALWLMGCRNALLSLVACTACIKYGIWAVIVITDFWAGGGAIRFPEAMLWVSHLGMAAEGAVYLRTYLFETLPGAGRGFTFPVLAAAGAWMLLNDILDYSLGIYPYLYVAGQESLAEASAFCLSLLLVLSAAVLPGIKPAGRL